MFTLHDGTLCCSKKRDQMKVYGESFHGSFKRCKQGDQTQDKLEKNSTPLFFQRSNTERAVVMKPDDVQLHLEAKTRSEIFEDHRTELDLNLNLSSSSSSSTVKRITKKDECSRGGALILTPAKKGKSGDLGLNRSPSWLAFEGEDDNQKKQEMVTTVCMKCHMLVMLSKSTLVCPNCKFMQTDDHSSTKQFKTLNLFKLLC